MNSVASLKREVRVVVVGAGVAGLTTAVVLAEAGALVHVIAEQVPGVTSLAAGAMWGPYLVEPKDNVDQWGQRSLEIFRRLADDPSTGVRLTSGIEASRTAEAPPEWATTLPGFRPCEPAELPAGFSAGYRFTVPLIDMPTYLAYLLRRLDAAGGTVERRRLVSLADADPAALIVNCTGLGAQELVPDHDLRPIRGQHVVVTNPGLTEFFSEDTGLSQDLLCFYPHGDTVVLGGTALDAELLAATDIGGLARVTGFGFHEGRPYAVTDPIEGEPFEDLLDPVARPLTWESVRAIGGQVIEILDALHRNGLPHLDLDAATLVRRHDGRVVVADPGLGVHGLPGDRGDAYRPWTAPPPAYRSPEQLFGRQVDHRSDLYALGCLFYAMVTGAAPALTHRAVRNAWAHGGPHPGPEFHSVHPPGFDALVTDLLAARPEDRPADAQTVKARLMSVPADDPELTAVAGTVLALDPDGTRMGRVLRDTIDSVLDGERTGRYDWTDLFKTERTHLGTLVEVAVQREFGFDDGDAMDYRIAGVEVDCKYSQRFGG